MAVSHNWNKKSPNQNPTAFVKGEQHGGARGKGSQAVPDKLSGGPMRERIEGRPNLGRSPQRDHGRKIT